MTRVAPVSGKAPHRQGSRLESSSIRLTLRVAQCYNACIWGLLAVLLFAQFFGVIWSSVKIPGRVLFGRDPALGKYSIPGFNDEPYADRAIACVKQSQSVRPMQLSQLLKGQRSRNASTLATTGVNGYRVVTRDSFTVDFASVASSVRQCNTISRTLDAILSVCETLGYNVTRDFLRIVDGIDAEEVLQLSTALPVLIIPFWDMGLPSRYIVPGHDGYACVFRAAGMYESDDMTSAFVSGVPRAARESATVKLLGYPGGVWRNGWYEDSVVRVRWYSDVISTLPEGRFSASQRRFELLNGVNELDCTQGPYGCGGGESQFKWSETLSQRSTVHSFDSVAISNGTRFGVFLYDGIRTKTITSYYSLSRLLSNSSFAVLLSRWLAAMVALWPLDTIGVGSLANSKSFHMLPLIILPRIKSSLEGFWTSGCIFEGNQRTLGDAWFEIYPAIGELVFVYFSLLNMVAKLLRRRASDVLFGPTLLFFGLLHYLREDLANTNWFEFDKRVAGVVTSSELEAASIFDYFTTDLALRTNGNVKSLFYMKVVVLGMNLLPLLLSRRVQDDVEATQAENALAMAFASSGGLGSTSNVYMPFMLLDSVDTSGVKGRLVRPYEVVRGRYVVVGISPSRALMSIDHWLWLIATAPVSIVALTLAVRVLIYDVESADTTNGEAESGLDVLTISALPQMVTVSDPILARITKWKISARTMR